MNELVLRIISEWARKLCNDVYAEWNRYQVEGKAEISFEIIESTVDTIVGQFMASGQKAWICEYGKGSLMKPDDLSKYKSSKYWNSFRKGTAISGRPSGTYWNLDDERQVSTGHSQGKDLEVTKIPMFQPISPKDTIRKIVMNRNSAFWVAMREDLEAALGRYVIEMVLPKGRLTMKL